MKDEIVAELKSLKACIVYDMLQINVPLTFTSRDKEKTALVTVELLKALWNIITRIEAIHTPEFDPDLDVINVCFDCI